MKGALRYRGADARRLGEVLRVRTLPRLGIDVRVGIGPTITVAETASGRIDAPGSVLALSPGQVVGWLGPLPVEALHGIGPKQAATLRENGLHSVGLLAALPPITMQRLLGGQAGRLAADRARGPGPRRRPPLRRPRAARVSQHAARIRRTHPGRRRGPPARSARPPHCHASPDSSFQPCRKGERVVPLKPPGMLWRNANTRHPDVLAVQRRGHARGRSEKGIR
ncbi:hypothetical protein OHS59_01005 [Streptomyces sp. NBC_00414]|uniref:hypothetical protein n=1 Tax=Streptomyces sp. NBC_00414 TaxID=2975739 RepID=UPI002E1FF9C4